MLKSTLFALATLIGAATLPSVASAIDNGPCDHCTMDPIIVTPTEDKDEDKDTNTQQVRPLKGMKVMNPR